jgi:hypothetical protein
MKSAGTIPAVDPMLAQARMLAQQGNDVAAAACFIDVLRIDHTNRAALLGIGELALRGGRRDAARTAFTQAASAHADDLISRLTLGNMDLEDDAPQLALAHYEGALAVQPDCPQTHQGMARAHAALGDDAQASLYREKGFRGHAVSPREYRGAGDGIDILYLAAATGGNVRLRRWIDDRRFAVTVIYPEFFDPEASLPPHRLIVNAIGDADLCAPALAGAAMIVAGSTAPVINHPAAVRRTGRDMIARLCMGMDGLVVPPVAVRSRPEILNDATLNVPLLIRSPGYHTGQHFVLVEQKKALAQSIASLPGDRLLTIGYLDARGIDGFARKYRVMFIGGKIFPVHLAISRHWKVHYYTADMATHPVFRSEEQRFLEDMPTVLGATAMRALEQLSAMLGLDYAGVDFALDREGRVLLFEANAVMTINSPPPEAIWDYRRRAFRMVHAATQQLFNERA